MQRHVLDRRSTADGDWNLISNTRRLILNYVGRFPALNGPEANAVIKRTHSFSSVCVCVCVCVCVWCVCVCVCVLYGRVTEVIDVPWVLYQCLIISNQLNVKWNCKRKMLDPWPVAIVSIGNVATSKRYSHWGIFSYHDFTKFCNRCNIFTTVFFFFLCCHFRFLPSIFPIVYISPQQMTHQLYKYRSIYRVFRGISPALR